VLVLDASVVVEVVLERLGVQALAILGDEQLTAPWLLWSEAPAALSAMVFRSEISRELGEAALGRLEDVDVEPRHPRSLIDRAWRIAKENGWAKTYDAEYLALAQILGCRLVTIDGPLWRRTRHLGFVVTPSELQPTANDPRTNPAA
jgi:predicted nucleic acid-binding protein